MSTPTAKQNTSVGVVIVVIVAGILLLIAFFAQLANNTSPQKSNKFQPIKGAFGFNLGDIPPPTYEIETNDNFAGDGITCKLPLPADLGLETNDDATCTLHLTDDHRIAEISVMSQENERFNLTNLKKILEEKYGPAKPDSAQTETNKSFQIGQGTNYISLQRPNTLYLIRKPRPLHRNV